MTFRDFDIAVLFAGYLAGNLTDEQHAELETWIMASEENRLLFERVCREENLEDLNRMAGQYDRVKAWKEVEKHLRPDKEIGFRRWTAWAAVLLLPLCVAYFLLPHSEKEDTPAPLSHGTAIHPGSSKALLTLADGSVVELKEAKSFSLREKDGTCIKKDSAMLSYRGDTSRLSARQHAPVYNRVDIPRGGEYSLILSDGTVVCLNAMSSLSYPVSFTGNTREVELSGEAYFEVKKDAARPFIVKTGDLKIQVLGTEFNVSAYADKHSVRTTLVNGSVQLGVDGQKPVILKPSQQAKFNKSSGKIKVKNVDVSMYIAWKNGMFDIRDWKLEDIMDYLSRWYDIHVFYQHESLKKMRFGCYINRYSEIEPILELFEKTGKVRAELKGNTVVFSCK